MSADFQETLIGVLDLENWLDDDEGRLLLLGLVYDLQVYWRLGLKWDWDEKLMQCKPLATGLPVVQRVVNQTRVLLYFPTRSLSLNKVRRTFVWTPQDLYCQHE